MRNVIVLNKILSLMSQSLGNNDMCSYLYETYFMLPFWPGLSCKRDLVKGQINIK